MTDPFSTGLPAGAVYGRLWKDAAVIAISKATLTQILKYSERDRAREVGGFLIGLWRPPVIEVRHFLPATFARSRATSLVFTHQTWSQLNRTIETKHPQQQVVGWQHTHPGLGVFLSGYDRFIHQHFFSAVWHVALVVDPQQGELGFFQWRHQEIVDCGFLLTDNW